jgi:polar amino acid transport system substrate-binding protein
LRKSITFFVLTVLFSKCIAAQEVLNINFGVAIFKPYSSIDENTGECVGIGFAVTKKLLQPKSFQINITCAAPARIYRSLSSGTVDLSLNIKSTLAVQDKVTFTTIPFDALMLNFYTNPDNALVDKRIAAIRGYDYNGFRATLTQQGFEFVDVSDSEDAIRIFANKRTKYLLSYKGPFEDYTINQKSEKELPTLTSAHTELLVAVPTYYAISKASVHHDVLVNVFSEIEQAATDNEFYIDAFKRLNN